MGIKDLQRCTFVVVLCVIFSASSAQRGPKLLRGKFITTVKPKQNDREYSDYYDYYDYYYDEEPLPSGPTRRPAPPAKSQKPGRETEPEYDYYEEKPLPAGPTREPPLPSGPTRRPGQARTFKPKPRNTVSPALNQFLNLPLLTTKAQETEGGQKSPRKEILEELGPFHQHFIAPPKLNAGALPLAFESDLPLNRFPPFNKPPTANRGDAEMRR
eukprot:TRINITY_DN3585_c0_g1_i1.p1 TRINITY_DN3585_c0_g1~~TRINITY_DN3585_c0_g1_i1.p1  ORF type:complete len:214 (-),score=51.84 TRINITY_DN3585_c0_g1_i1:83-724(-)